MFDMPRLTRPFYILRQLTRKLWVRTSLIAALAVVSAAAGPLLGPVVPDWLADRLSDVAVGRILEILASSMLAVTTFSLSVMVVARQWASNQSTPRAHRVVQEDPITQNALATFLGAFVFALASLILVEIDAYAGRALVVGLGFTIIVILLVVLAILRWIDHLSDLGGVSETAGKVETMTRDAFDRRAEAPCLGGLACTPGDIPETAASVPAETTGYVRHLDTGILDRAASEADAHVWVLARPGVLVTEGEPLLRMSAPLDADTLRSAFVIGPDRSFDQDPRYGLLVLSEIAQRALSPGVNDPGTAISIISRLLRLLLPVTTGADRADGEPAFPHVSVAPLAASDFLGDAFDAIARDADGKVEVHLALQDALKRLGTCGDAGLRRAAPDTARRALAFAEQGLTLAEDHDRVRAVFEGMGRADT